MRILLALLFTAAALPAQTPAATLDQAESLWKQHRYVEANDVFRALVAAHPRNAEYRVRWGRLFLERFQPLDAAQLFNEALDIQPKRADALLGLALVAADGFEAQATHFAHQALDADPHLLEAQELLARLALEDSNPAKAPLKKRTRPSPCRPTPRKLKPSSPPSTWLNDKPDTPWDPHSGPAYETAARIFVLNRRYEDAIKLYLQSYRRAARLMERTLAIRH